MGLGERRLHHVQTLLLAEADARAAQDLEADPSGTRGGLRPDRRQEARPDGHENGARIDGRRVVSRDGGAKASSYEVANHAEHERDEQDGGSDGRDVIDDLEPERCRARKHPPTIVVGASLAKCTKDSTFRLTKNTPPRHMPNQMAAHIPRLRSNHKEIIAPCPLQYSTPMNNRKRMPATVSRAIIRALLHAYVVPPHERANRRQIVTDTNVKVPSKSRRAIWLRNPVSSDVFLPPRRPS